jgi:hypothetical protein
MCKEEWYIKIWWVRVGIWGGGNVGRIGKGFKVMNVVSLVWGFKLV